MSISLNDYIVNPLNQRLMKINSQKYKKLVSEGVFVHNYENDDKVLCVIDNESNIKELVEYHNEKLEGYQAVRGRGIYKNYLVKKKCRTKVDKEKETKKMELLIKEAIKQKENNKMIDLKELSKRAIENINNKFDTNSKSKYYLEL